MIAIQPVTINNVEYQVELATIDGTMLGIEDHGIFTSFVYLKYLGAGYQGAGGISLDGHNEDGPYDRKGHVGSIVFLRRTLETVGVDTWEKLKGKKVFALKEPGFTGLIRGLMSADDPTKYFIFEDCFK